MGIKSSFRKREGSEQLSSNRYSQGKRKKRISSSLPRFAKKKGKAERFPGNRREKEKGGSPKPRRAKKKKEVWHEFE